jgi:hypothetical protein
VYVAPIFELPILALTSSFLFLQITVTLFTSSLFLFSVPSWHVRLLGLCFCSTSLFGLFHSLVVFPVLLETGETINLFVAKRLCNRSKRNNRPPGICNKAGKNKGRGRNKSPGSDEVRGGGRGNEVFFGGQPPVAVPLASFEDPAFALGNSSREGRPKVSKKESRKKESKVKW